MMDILSIGNSFSQDAQRYLHRIAAADGFSANTFNLYIGGCPLSRHYRNMLSEKKAYMLEMNGESTGFEVSLKEALLTRSWDVITLQQVSHEAPFYETYQPYLNKIAEYVRLFSPKSKIVIHQTWAYEEASVRLTSELGYNSHIDMLRDIKASYEQAASAINADFIIRSGELLEKLIDCGFKKIHRDTFHASLGTGRYALGLLWYAGLTGNAVIGNGFSDFDEDISNEEIQKIQKCVSELCNIK